MKLNVAVIYGSRTCEHDVSVISGMQAAGALNQSEYGVERVYIAGDGKWYVGEALKDMKFYQKTRFCKTDACDPGGGRAEAQALARTAQAGVFLSGCLGRTTPFTANMTWYCRFCMA